MDEMKEAIEKLQKDFDKSIEVENAHNKAIYTLMENVNELVNQVNIQKWKIDYLVDTVNTLVDILCTGRRQLPFLPPEVPNSNLHYLKKEDRDWLIVRASLAKFLGPGLDDFASLVANSNNVEWQAMFQMISPLLEKHIMGVPVNRNTISEERYEDLLKFFYFLQSQEWNDYVSSLSQEEE